MSFRDELVGLIRDEVARALAAREVTAHGTLTQRTTATTGEVTASGSALAVRVLVPGDLLAVAGDRVALLRVGSDWVVVCAFPEHP